MDDGDEWLERIRRVVAAELEPITEVADVDLDLWAAGMTSLAGVGLMVAVETAFGFEFPDSALSLETFSTVRRIAAVARDVSAGAGTPQPW